MITGLLPSDPQVMMNMMRLTFEFDTSCLLIKTNKTVLY